MYDVLLAGIFHFHLVPLICSFIEVCRRAPAVPFTVSGISSGSSPSIVHPHLTEPTNAGLIRHGSDFKDLTSAQRVRLENE